MAPEHRPSRAAASTVVAARAAAGAAGIVCQHLSVARVVAMDGFTGFETAAAETVPDAVADPFHVVALAGDNLDRCRQRVQQQTCGHRSHTGDPLYGIRRVLRPGAELLTDKQKTRLAAVFADDAHIQVETTWLFYQRIVAAYRDSDRAAARTALTNVIGELSSGVPAPLTELATLGPTLKKRAVDVLACFGRPGHRTDRQKRSTAGWNTYAAPRWASATSPTTSPVASFSSVVDRRERSGRRHPKRQR